MKPGPQAAFFCCLLLSGNAVEAQALHDYVSPRLLKGSLSGPRADSRPRPDRHTTLSPDRQTTKYSRPSYQVSFDPSVMPFKRGKVYDAVASDGKLFVEDRTQRLVPLAKKPTGQGWTRFATTIHLPAMAKPIAVPIPSVAATMVLSHVSTKPPNQSFILLKDGADNYFLRPASPLPRATTVHLELWAQARSFGGPLPKTMAGSCRSCRFLPGKLAALAARVITAIGLKHRQRRMDILKRLVTYFRSFVVGPLSLDTGSTYLDIALSRRGVCRHRAYAFVITALALGIPARMVTNEIHAFVEVRLAPDWWRRVDLGGATPNPTSSRTVARIHRPGPDPFPWPGSSRPSRHYGSSLIRHSGGTSTRTGSGRVGIPGTHGTGVAVDRRSGQGPTTVVLDLTESDPVRVGTLTIRSTGLRGSPIRVTGMLTTSDGRSLGKRRVQVILARPGSSRGYPLGWTTTDERGRFVIRKPLPMDIPVGLYRVLVGR